MTMDAYREHRRASGAAKSRAMALLAEGTHAARIEAARLLHDAAERELAALESLDAPPAAARASVLAEVCGCYLEGGDPVWASIRWGELTHAYQQTDAATTTPVETAYSELKARLDEQISRLQRLLDGIPEPIRRVTQASGFGALDAGERQTLDRQLHAILTAFPGLSHVWVVSSLVAHHAGDDDRAWRDIEHAVALRPYLDRAHPLGVALHYVAEGRPGPTARDDLLDHVYAERASLPVDVLLAFVLAELRPQGSAARLARAEAALNLARAQAPASSQWARFVEAAGELLRARLEDRDVGHQPLYRAGLGFHARRDRSTLDTLVELTAPAAPVLAA
ncbi:MAG: hypothetical protein H6704_26315 [Myxococcales bacterium]|nr:hypothetical protein [Myxococcales bacterium]MCB9539742.1 hypothetical protein [Myxococcales bacterium]